MTQTEHGYNFTTDAGLIYNLYFSTYYLQNNHGEEVKAMMVGFYRHPINVPYKSYDEKVKYTILFAINDYLEKNRSIGLVYICDTAGGFARHRRIIFGQWYKAANQHIVEKFNCKAIHAKAGFYCSLLIRTDNPLKDMFVDAFYKSIAAFFPEELEEV